MVVTATGGGALAVKGGDDAWAGLRTLWTGDIQDSFLDKGVAAIGESIGASDGAISFAQGIAGAVGNPANIAKEGAERAVREGAEEVAERAARETAEEGAERAAREGAEEASEGTARKNSRVSSTCYATAMAAITVARANGETYVGGPHNGVSAFSEKNVFESHHIPPKRTGGLTVGRGPAILMDYGDHLDTQTWGNSRGNRDQRALAGGGKAGYLRALASDIKDVKLIAAASGNPSKYDKAIAMAQTYAACLAAAGELK